jgi:hypothetical protein
MVYSAQLTSSSSYPVPTSFYPGINNAIEIPIPNGVLTSADSFTLDNLGHLQYTGDKMDKIAVKAKFSFGAIQPSQFDPSFPLDQGPKAVLYAYVQVGNQQSVPVRLDFTMYYFAFEWPIVIYSLDVDQIFNFQPNDTVKFFAYYNFTVPPAYPVDPNTFYVTLNQVNLSLLINSKREDHNDAVLPAPLKDENKVAIVSGANVNTNLYQFRAGVTGRTLISVRMDILQLTVNNSDTSLDTIATNTDWYAYLSVNGVLNPANIVFQTITNQPNLSNGNTVWPASVELLLLADLNEWDNVAVIANITNVIVPSASPPFILVPPDGHATINASLKYNIILAPSLEAKAMAFPNYNSTILVPIDGKSVELPLNGDVKYSEDFQMEEGKLIYKGKHHKTFRVRASLNVNKFLLINSNSDPVVTSLQNMSFALGVNGEKDNSVETDTLMYSDTRYDFKWLANQSVTNVVALHEGEYLSLLVKAGNVTYLNTPPMIGVNIPNLRSPEGSVILLSGMVSVVIEESTAKIL